MNPNLAGYYSGCAGQPAAAGRAGGSRLARDEAVGVGAPRCAGVTWRRVIAAGLAEWTARLPRGAARADGRPAAIPSGTAG